VKPTTSLPAVSFSDFAPRAASSQAPAIDVEESASLYPPVVSMDDLDAASAQGATQTEVAHDGRDDGLRLELVALPHGDREDREDRDD